MLRNTFCHIPGIGPKSERRLWDAGVTAWDALTDETTRRLPRKRRTLLLDAVRESERQLADGNARFFGDAIPANQAWRLFPDFSHSVAYLDIETTGLSGDRDYVTTIAVYDGEHIFDFVRGRNLDEFEACISRYKLLVTFNGKTFDLPFLRRHLGIALEQAHIDLRYVLAGIGLTGGLKQCEKRLGLARHELEAVDGYFAVLLWFDYMRNGNGKALETLLAYNIADVVNLASIMPLAYNMKIQETPFAQTHALPLSPPANIPYQPDAGTINRLMRDAYR